MIDYGQKYGLDPSFTNSNWTSVCMHGRNVD